MIKEINCNNALQEDYFTLLITDDGILKSQELFWDDELNKYIATDSEDNITEIYSVETLISLSKLGNNEIKFFIDESDELIDYQIVDDYPRDGSNFIVIWRYENDIWSNVYRINDKTVERYNEEIDDWKQSYLPTISTAKYVIIK